MIEVDDTPPYVELLWPVIPKGDVDGSLDWVSGVMALDVDTGTWADLNNAPAEARNAAITAYRHEYFHLIQLSVMDYLGDWAAQLFNLMRPAVRRVNDDLQANGFAVIKKLIEEGSSLLSGEERDAIGEHYRHLDTPGDSGLTARSILECQAYFVERRFHYEFQRSSDWTGHLASAPAHMYRIPFDFLAYATGYGVAYEWFCLIASASLCSSDPVATFELLTLELAADDDAKKIRNDGTTAVEMVQFVRRIFPDTHWSTQWDDTTHPVFTRTSNRLRKAIAEGEVDGALLLCRPDLLLDTIDQLDGMEVPIIFKPMPRRQLGVTVPPDSDFGAALGLFTMGAVGRQLTQFAAIASQEVGAAAIEKLTWLIREHDQILCKLAYADLVSGSPDRILQVLDPLNDLSEVKPKSWGRWVLLLPEELDPRQDRHLPTVPEARNLLRAVYRKLPMFPVYLAPQAGLYDWIGSVAPDDARDGEKINILHPQVVNLFTEAERAIVKCGAKLGQNPWLAIQCLFGPAYRAQEASRG